MRDGQTTAPLATERPGPPLRVELLVAIAASLSGCDGLFGPSSYDECILKYLKANASEQAVYAITDACRARFPERVLADEAPLPAEARAVLSGRAHLTAGRFRGLIYNGNKDWTVTKLTIQLVPTDVDPSRTGQLLESPLLALIEEAEALPQPPTRPPVRPATRPKPREYVVDVTVAPLASTEFAIPVLADSNQHLGAWVITGAQGHQATDVR